MLFESYQTAENDALRAYLEDGQGRDRRRSWPSRIDEDKTTRCKKWDVITHVGPHAIDNQGYVDVRDGLRLKFLYYVPKLASDGKVELTILRDGKRRSSRAGGRRTATCSCRR